MGILANNLRFLRLREGLSQQALADSINLKRGNIASYEKGIAEPSIEKLLRISKRFKIDVDQLIQTDLAQESSKSAEIEESVQLTEEERLSRMQLILTQSQQMGIAVEGFVAYSAVRKNPNLEELLIDYQRITTLAQQAIEMIQELYTLALIKGSD